MIDYKAFEEALKEPEGFIDQSDLIDEELIQYIAGKKNLNNVFNILFKKRQGGERYTCELECNVCQEIDIQELSYTALTALITRMKSSGEIQYNCDDCKQKQLREESKQHDAYVEAKHKEAKEIANQQLNKWLDPGKDELPFYGFSELTFIARYLDNEFYEEINKMKYYDFLKTKYWKVLSAHVKKSNRYKCQLCYSNKNLVTHHKTYANHGYEHKYWKTDLICLCNDCHEKFHDKVSIPKPSFVMYINPFD